MISLSLVREEMKTARFYRNEKLELECLTYLRIHASARHSQSVEVSIQLIEFFLDLLHLYFLINN